MNPETYEKNKKRCLRFGHDWAYQDCESFMVKICLRCGEIIHFFPEEVDE